MKYILIIGAKSDIAKELARIYAANGFCLYLVARKSDELIPFKEEIGNSGVDIQLLELDVTCFDLHQEFYKILDPKPAGVIFVAGILFSQVEYDNNWDKIIKTINTNYVGALSILNIIAADFEKRKDGFIIGIGSVAGDRGRRSNYIYGSTKAAFASYLSGLRSRMHKSNVHVMTVKPGFVKTKMTKYMTFPNFLSMQPRRIAEIVYKAQQNKKDIVYAGSRWKFIMFIIKLIPETIFKRINL